MASYLLKRLLLAIPVLWLIATIIFLLSKTMPGTYGSEQLQQGDPGYYSKGDADAREKAYRQFLKATGQDLPLFYFSVSSQVVPDTLYRIYPVRDQEFVKRLGWLYGDAAHAAIFYKSLKEIEQSTSPAQRKQLQPYLQIIYQHTQPAALQEAVQAMELLIPADLLARTRLQDHTAALLSGRSRYAYLLPSWHWHGTDNQYHLWARSLLTGDMGTSLRDSRPVARVLLDAIGNTWWLLLISMVAATLLSMEMALLMVRQSGRKWRKGLLPFLFLLDSIPVFVLAMVLLVLLASPAFLQLFPVYGMGYYSPVPLTWFQAISQWLQFMALPMLCLVLVNLPYLTNQFYHALAAVASQDYIRTARAKGLSEGAVIRKHMLRNALLPVITLLSDFLPALVAGAVIIETIFAIPGIGRLLIDSVLARDYPVIVGIVIIIAVFKLLAHLLSDLLYALADPRIRHTAS
jgi:peptide/nickel transport system permease protein